MWYKRCDIENDNNLVCMINKLVYIRVISFDSIVLLLSPLLLAFTSSSGILIKPLLLKLALLPILLLLLLLLLSLILIIILVLLIVRLSALGGLLSWIIDSLVILLIAILLVSLSLLWAPPHHLGSVHHHFAGREFISSLLRHGIAGGHHLFVKEFSHVGLLSQGSFNEPDNSLFLIKMDIGGVDQFLTNEPSGLLRIL